MRVLPDILKKSRFCTVCIIVGMMFFSTGCSGFPVKWPVAEEPASAPAVNSPDNAPTSLGLTPDLDYEKPVLTSHIETDQLGYLNKSRKIAVFRGDVLADTFDIVSAYSGDVVYTGEIKSKSVQGSGETYYYGDFSDFTTSGRFCIKTDVIGYSYPFGIGYDIYDGVLPDALKQYYLNRCGMSLTAVYAGDSVRNACHTDPVPLQTDAGTKLDVNGGWHVSTSGDRDVIKGCNTVETLLLAFEYNPEAFLTDTGIPESSDEIPDILDEIRIETDWLLKMQDASTGAVYAGVISTDKGLGLDNPVFIAPTDMSATLSFASSLAYFSYIYQAYDTEYATTCLQAADRAMKYAARFEETTDDDEYFRAAAMLYRATGYANYKSIVENYASSRTEYNIADNAVFSGVVTYLATKQKTDPKICNVMMNGLRSFAENTASKRRDVLYLLENGMQIADQQAILSEIARLTVANYIVSSNEYENVCEQYLHFFLGCNPYNTCYVGTYGSLNISDKTPAMDIFRQPENDAYFILLLSGIVKD